MAARRPPDFHQNTKPGKPSNKAEAKTNRKQDQKPNKRKANKEHHENQKNEDQQPRERGKKRGPRAKEWFAVDAMDGWMMRSEFWAGRLLQLSGQPALLETYLYTHTRSKLVHLQVHIE